MAFYRVMDHKIKHNTSKKLATTNKLTAITAMILLVTAAAIVVLSMSLGSPVNAQNKTQSQKSANTTTKTAAGNIKQLSQLGVGANNQTLGNNTAIGNPSAGKSASTEQKINATTPKTGLPSNPTGKGQK
jgi:negative regulator of sigma E activity